MSIEKLKQHYAKAPPGTYVYIPCGVMAQAAIELGDEHHAPGSAGHEAKKLAFGGFTVKVDEEVELPVGADPERPQGYHRDKHLGPILAAIAAREAAADQRPESGAGAAPASPTTPPTPAPVKG